MKKIYILTAVLALLTLSLNAQTIATKNGPVAQKNTSTENVAKAPNQANRALSVTVGDQSTTSTSLPVNGLYQDYGYRSQMIYPSSLLSSNGLSVGDQIKSLTFYPNGGIKFAASTVTFQLCHTNTNNFGTSSNSSVSRISVGSDAVTATVTPTQDANATSWTITFGTPLTYNGGNLLLDVYCVGYNHDNTTGGACNTTTFYGTSQTNYQSMAYNGTRTVTPAENGTGSNNKFLPKTTFGLLVTDPTIEASSDNVSLSAIPGSTDSKTINVSGYNLTGNISVSKSGQDASLFSVSPTTLSASGGSASGSLTISYSPTVIGNHTATIILSSPGAEDVTITLSGTCTNFVCNGINTNEYLPVHGWYFEKDQHNQMVYPAEMLTGLVGKTLTSITFYPVSGINFKKTSSTNGTVSFTLGSLDANVDNVYDSTSPTLKSGYSSTPNGTIQMPEDSQASLTEWVITFTTPFAYTGGDLLIDVQTDHGTYGATSFYGQEQDTYQSYYSRDGSSATALKFLPKVSFTYENPQHDLAVTSVTAPASAAAGSTVTVTATVSNAGSYAEQGQDYTVTFSADGTTFDTQTGTTLAIGGSTTFTANYPTNANDGGQTVTFTVTVTFANDADATNNSTTASTSLVTLPPPENVVATGGANQTATVTWAAPNSSSAFPLAPASLVWDFEEQSDFTAFTAIDSDGDGYNWGWHYNSGSGNYEVHSGDGVIYSQSYDKATETILYPDNWLISPQVTLGGSISFWACGQDPNQYWNEVFAVYVCEGSYNGVSDFTKISPDVTTTHDMTEYTYDLSQYSGTGYVAIRHYNVHDEFILVVDDMTCIYMVPTPPESYNVYLDGVLVGNVDNNDPLTYTFNNVSDGDHTCQVSAVYPGPIESALVPATFIILPTPNAPTVIPATGDANVIITITPAAPATSNDLVYDVIDQNGNHSQDLTWPRGETDYVVTVHAYTTATSNYNQSPEAVVPITVPALPATAAPSIEITSTTDSEVTITATGNGTVTLTVNGQTVSGSGSVSITLPRHMEDYTVTATATAKEENHPAGSTTQDVTIPGRSGQGWMLMDGDYLNGSDQLSFIDALTQEPILFIDQYSGDTEFNAHPASYKYTLEEVTADNPKKSGEVPIYIPKIDSKLTGVYTQDEVDNDDYGTATEMTPDVVNGTMSYKIAANDSVAFYGLYRGDAGVAYPELNDSHMISKLRQFGEQGSWYFDEMVSGKSVSPVYQDFVDYDEVDVVRWDQDYLQDSPNGTGTYVPVIWISAMSTGRKDMIDNSYGSDIKEVVLGDVEPTIYLVSSGNSAWGKWKYQGQDYMVYNPQLEIEGLAPADAEEGAKDGDQYIYTPYMYRAWLKYSGARYYTRNADGHLEDAGEMPSLIPLGSVMITSETEDPYHVELGERWDENNPTAQIPNSFGAPANLRIDDLEFIVRFYYKKTVAEAPTGSKLAANRDGDAKGEYYIVEKKKSQGQIITAVDEFFGDRIVVDVTYVNALGQQSSKPFDGVNIIVTRYSDGTTTTTKVVR